MEYFQDYAFPFPPQQHAHHPHSRPPTHIPPQHLAHPASYPPPQMFYPQMPYAPYGPGPSLEEMYRQYPPTDYVDYMQHGFFPEDYEDMGEISTRPRLTKEQVEILESQFQAHPKPNSNVKRQLALQTKLTLPRVANWFQNRRAKAKQQKKQEEFEQSLAAANAGRQSNSNQSSISKPSQSEGSATSASSVDGTASPEKDSHSNHSPIDPSHAEDYKDAWNSLQRQIGAAKAAHQQQAQQLSQDMISMPPPDTTAVPAKLPSSHATPIVPDLPEWSNKTPSLDLWTSPHDLADAQFDFGFDQADESEMGRHEMKSDEDMSSQAFVLSPEAWQEPLMTPKLPPHAIDQTGLAQSPGLPMPTFPTSRRGSMADEITANFGQFALASSSPHPMVCRLPDNLRQPDQIDIAARRKRPRPAALTSASLRSRSYGAMTSVSPTFRQTITPGSHTVRHVKSTGHSLNTHYSGIRKASSAQRSPMNIASFAEAEAFHKLMAQQAAVAQVQSTAQTTTSGSTMDLSAPILSPDLVMHSRVSSPDRTTIVPSKLDIASHYQLAATQHLTLASASPPGTPFRPEFMAQTIASSAPPVSAPPQFASFPDTTPPYSAGPLTNSSWSDAPLTSPDMPTFPANFVPSFNLNNTSDTVTGAFQPYLIHSDSKTELGLTGDKKTEFFIQEFPNQKAEHKHVAQQLAQQKPKAYVFANSAPSDFDQ